MRSSIIGLALVVALLPMTRIQAAASDSSGKAQQIATTLEQSGQLKDFRVGVEYQDGVARLTGTVASMEQKSIAERLARDSQDVTHVVSRLVVEGGPAEYTPQRDLGIRVASNRVEAAEHAIRFGQRNQQRAAAGEQTIRLRQQSQSGRRTPQNNMPVPYARTAVVQRGRGVQPANYSRQAQYSADGRWPARRYGWPWPGCRWAIGQLRQPPDARLRLA